MNIKVFASGSGGNCMLLSDRDTHLLIDAGISMRRVLSSLHAAGLDIQDIGGVLITHEHSDHVSGLKMLLRYYDLPLYAPHTVAARLCGLLPQAAEHMNVIPTGEDFQIGRLTVRAFHTPHDTDESVGYRVEGRGIFALATDMGHVTDEVLAGLLGADTVLIESNHDLAMLSDGPYPVSLKRRILSDHGHLSNADCAALAERLVEQGTQTVILGHLSRENNRPELAMEETGRLLQGSGARLYCAPPWGCLSVEVKERVLCST
ncbi:MAG: MBL fold metallo-hydrolase [Oscillospiraceae bacterium]|nr:MBL fold metallo-hydrolase [Oscillospiraceae bacterium]